MLWFCIVQRPQKWLVRGLGESRKKGHAPYVNVKEFGQKTSQGVASCKSGEGHPTGWWHSEQLGKLINGPITLHECCFLFNTS